MATVYMTVQGRSRDTTAAIHSSDATLGVESSNDWLPYTTPRFVDYPFTDPEASFDDHLRVVREVRPDLTVAPDVEKGRTLREAVEKADELAEYAGDVVIVPKDCHPSEVPERFRVGVPAADFGSDASWTVWDYKDCGTVHILGGGPARQLRFREYLPVASVDTSSLGKIARFGWWRGKSVDAPDWMDYRFRLKYSLDAYAAAWE